MTITDIPEESWNMLYSAIEGLLKGIVTIIKWCLLV